MRERATSAENGWFPLWPVTGCERLPGPARGILCSRPTCERCSRQTPITRGAVREPLIQRLPEPGTFRAQTSKAARAPEEVGAGLELCRAKLPKLGTLQTKTSKAWNFPRQNFQGLELFRVKLPKLGTLQDKTSKAWNFSQQIFQGLELFREKLPKLGTFCSKTSRAARPPRGVGAGLEHVGQNFQSRPDRVSGWKARNVSGPESEVLSRGGER